MDGLPNERIPDRYVPQLEGSQYSDHRLSTSRGVVDRPDHHCGDDLVFSNATRRVGSRNTLNVLFVDGCQSVRWYVGCGRQPQRLEGMRRMRAGRLSARTDHGRTLRLSQMVFPVRTMQPNSQVSHVRTCQTPMA